MSGGWDLSLDAMTELAHAFKTAEYQKYLDRYADSMAKTGKVFDLESGEVKEAADKPGERERVDRMIEAAILHIDEAEPIWVSGDVAALVEHAAQAPCPKCKGKGCETCNGTGISFKSQAIQLEDLFTEHGFALFEQPLTTVDVRGLELRYRAMSWSIAKYDALFNPWPVNALLMCMWTHRDDPDPLYEKLGDNHRRPPLIGGSPFYLTHIDLMPLGEARFRQEPIISRAVAQYESLWRLAQQRIVVAAPERTSRATWKRASKWREVKEVTVLRLRRLVYTKTDYEGEPQDVEWSHRWMVKGFWRDQYYSSLGPVGDPKAYKQIWIDEYEKGPPDKPLVLKKHAVEFTR